MVTQASGSEDLGFSPNLDTFWLGGLGAAVGVFSHSVSSSGKWRY